MQYIGILSDIRMKVMINRNKIMHHKWTRIFSQQAGTRKFLKFHFRVGVRLSLIIMVTEHKQKYFKHDQYNA